MTAKGVTRRGGIPPITVRPGLYVSMTVVTIILAALTLPATVPDRPGFAYFSGGVIGAGLLLVILLLADLVRAAVARRGGIHVSGITLGAFGSRLVIARTGSDASPRDGWTAARARAHAAGAPTDAGAAGAGPSNPFTPATGDALVDARIARAGLLVTGLAGAVLVALGAVAPAGTLALVGQVALWVGTFALLVTAIDLLPAPRSAGGRVLAARVLRRTGSVARAQAAVAKAGVITGWFLIAIGVAASFLIGLVGLWAVLLGWLVLGTSRLAQAQQRTSNALDGLFVRDAMLPAPEPLSAWKTVASALDEVVLPSRRSVFGVQDFAGSLVGVALLRDLAAVPLDDRNLARVSRVLTPLERVATARPDEPLADMPSRLAERPAAGAVIVVEDDPDGTTRMVGVVGPAEITHAIETAPLRGRIVPAPVGFGRSHR